MVGLDATIKSMGLSAQTSASKVGDLAGALMATTGFADEELASAAEIFMRMDNFDPTNLKAMLQATADFAAGTGQDAASAAQAIASALETGNTRALHFSRALREQVMSMVEAGNSADALALVMDTLNEKYGGQAVAQMDTYAGSVKATKNAWDEFWEAMGNKYLPQATAFNQKQAEIVNNQTAGIQKANEYNEVYQKAIDLYYEMNGANAALNFNIDQYIKLVKLDTESGKELDYVIQDTANDVGNLANKFKELSAAQQLSSITSFAQTYSAGVDNITAAYSALNTANAEYWDLVHKGASQSDLDTAKAKVDDMTSALDKAKQAARDATNEMIAGFLQTQLTLDGVFDEPDMNKVLAYRKAVGLLTDSEYNAALQAMGLAEKLAAAKDIDLVLKPKLSLANKADLLDELGSLTDLSKGKGKSAVTTAQVKIPANFSYEDVTHGTDGPTLPDYKKQLDVITKYPAISKYVTTYYRDVYLGTAGFPQGGGKGAGGGGGGSGDNGMGTFLNPIGLHGALPVGGASDLWMPRLGQYIAKAINAEQAKRSW